MQKADIKVILSNHTSGKSHACWMFDSVFPLLTLVFTPQETTEFRSSAGSFLIIFFFVSWYFLECVHVAAEVVWVCFCASVSVFPCVQCIHACVVCLCVCVPVLCICVLRDTLRRPVLVDGLSSIHAMFVPLIRMSTSDCMCSCVGVCLSGVLYLI